ncbi:MAG: hypothetical protein GX561_00610 [Lentisphaerae bacterium]|jgi:hypothetical protein|nr:hypothetical protein [Lentisphaerota bacterium]
MRPACARTDSTRLNRNPRKLKNADTQLTTRQLTDTQANDNAITLWFTRDITYQTTEFNSKSQPREVGNTKPSKAFLNQRLDT